MKPDKSKPRIRLVEGKWYAFSGRGERRTRNTLLFCAIGFCRRLNAKMNASKPYRGGVVT